MQFLIKLALKNLSRHKLRTFISLIAIAFSVMVVVFARGYIMGMIDSFVMHSVQYDTGHIKIITEEYRKQQRLLPLNFPVDGYNQEGIDPMIAEISKMDNIKSVMPRLKFGAIIGGDNDVTTLLAWGVDPEKELKNTGIRSYIKEGRMLQLGKREIVMGGMMMDNLGKKVGDKVTIVYNTSFNSMKGTTFTIVGRIESGMAMLNELVVYLPLDEVQRLLYMEGQTTELVVFTKNIGMSDKVLPKLKAAVEAKDTEKKYAVLSYKETSELLPWMEMARLIYNEIYIFIVLLASIVVINTMIMIVKERTKEIGMMTAMGLNSRDILNLFILEGAVMGAIGSFAGALVGTLIGLYTSVKGLDMSSAVSGFSKDIMFNAIVYPVNSVSNAIFAFVLGTIIVTLACIIPARRASRLEPAEAIRDE